MSSLNINLTEVNAETVLLEFSGALDESSGERLPELSSRRYIFDLSKVVRVSSAGADVWCRWTRGQEKNKAVISLQKIPACFIRVANVITDVIPKTWEIESFFVPYISSNQTASENILFEKDRHFSKTELVIPPKVQGEIEPQALEPDIHPAKYFRFLWHRWPEMKIKTLSI